jgi:nitroimidazol reductase NimA-like FMN-containing flavoprotein (pyridoxamine 5'-phosphate oxidase superfamily)
VIEPKVKERIEKTLDTQSIAVLATSKNDEPYSCLVGFEVADSFRTFLFATMRQRLKYRNIMANPRVALTIDDRDKTESDFNETNSITVVGTASDTEGVERSRYAGLLVKRHRALQSFVDSPDCAVIKVDVDKIYFVSEFESVVVIGF